MTRLAQSWISFWERVLRFKYPRKLSDVTIRTFFQRWFVNHLPIILLICGSLLWIGYRQAIEPSYLLVINVLPKVIRTLLIFEFVLVAMAKMMKRFGGLTTGLLIAAVVGIAGIYGFQAFEEFKTKAKESEFKTYLGAYMTALKGYNQEFGEYPSIKDVSKLGFTPDGSIKIYSNEVELPPELRALVPQSRLPFIDKHTYRLIAVDTRKPDWIFAVEPGKIERVR